MDVETLQSEIEALKDQLKVTKANAKGEVKDAKDEAKELKNEIKELAQQLAAGTSRPTTTRWPVSPRRRRRWLRRRPRRQPTRWAQLLAGFAPVHVMSVVAELTTAREGLAKLISSGALTQALLDDIGEALDAMIEEYNVATASITV